MKERVEAIQARAWSTSGFKHLMNDEAFPLSAQYKAPMEVQRFVGDTIALWDIFVPFPVIPEGSTNGKYQEKVTLPFIWSAWDLLSQNEKIPRQVEIKKNLSLATAPTGSMQAKALGETVSRQFAFVFDSGLMVSLTQLYHGISGIVIDNDLSSSRLRILNHNYDLDVFQVGNRPDALDYLANVCRSLVIAEDPFSAGAAKFSYDFKFCSMFLRDAFMFLVAHEYGHIHLSHFDDLTSTEEICMREGDADMWAFYDLYSSLNTMNKPTEPAFVNVMILFFCFELIYRTVHLLSIGLDYGHLTEAHQRALQCPRNRHWQPSPRRAWLAERIMQNSGDQGEKIRQNFVILERLFAAIWNHMYIRNFQFSLTHKVSQLWHEQLKHIEDVKKSQ